MNTVIEKCDNGEFLVLGGDFNCVERNIDRNHVEPHMASHRKLVQMIEVNELCDVWRNFRHLSFFYKWLNCSSRFL